MNTNLNEIDLYECEYCDKRFINLNKFKTHSCKYTKRADIIDTPEFKSAFSLYKSWRKYTSFPCKNNKEFIKSKYFISFIKFSNFNEKYGIPDLPHYFEYMQHTSPMPSSWVNEDLYLKYIEYFDNTKTNEELIHLSIKTIHKLQDIFQCELNQTVFNLSYMEMVRLISSRKLSPIFLLLWRPFYVYLSTKLTKMEKAALLCVVDNVKWSNYFKNNKIEIEHIKKIMDKYGLS